MYHSKAQCNYINAPGQKMCLSHRQKKLLWVISLTLITGFLVEAKSGRLLLRRRGGIEHQVTSKNCTGVFFSYNTSGMYECACVSGVWGFYDEFCGEPSFFLGGYNYCFGLALNKTLAQTALFGNFRDPFEPSISHFQKENFVQLTTTITDGEYHEENHIEVDALGSWLTVTNSNWTLYGDGGESICLRPTVPGHKVICTYNQRLLQAVESMKWNYITRVVKGCFANVSVKADACYPFRRPNDKSECKNTPPALTPCPDPEVKNDTNPYDPFCEADTEVTSLAPPQLIPRCGDITREDVKKYWLDPANNQCAKSINEALLTDQLKRFAAVRFDEQFDSRLKSLDQIKQLITYSRDIIKKTCSDDYVPVEFFDVAAQAFIMFVNEDFFYGVEGIDSISYERIINTLKACWKRAEGFIYESELLGCELKRITGSLILPGEKFEITIPENAKSKHFEPLIETTWKMFLNAHSYCFEDFQIPNDHHHFSILFLELFSKTLYEKWIEPLANKELYKFILPKFSLMKEIMENVDYCVAAAGKISKCPVWLTRSNPEAKSIADSVDDSPSVDSRVSKSSSDSTNTAFHNRKKRSTWVQGIYAERITIWNGEAYCVQNMIDPSRLGLATCSEVF